MHRHLHLRRAVGLGAIATLSLLVIGPARGELRGAATTLAAQPAPSSATPAASHSAACTVATDQVRFDFPLSRTARLLVSGLPIKIVALVSASTYGVGASTPDACYPSRLSAASPLPSCRPQVSPGAMLFRRKRLPLVMRKGSTYFWMRSRISRLAIA